MLVLLAILLAFLAQNLLTPLPYDFAAVCVALTLLAFFSFSQTQNEFVIRREGMLNALLMLIGIVIAWQLLPAPLAALCIFALAGVVFTHAVNSTAVDAPPAPTRAPSQRFQVAVFALILIASTVLYVYDNEHIQPGLHGDEAESGVEARNINAGKYNTLIGVGWYDQALPSFLAQAIGLRAFGNTVGGLRTTSALVSLLTLPLVFVLARKLFNTRVAFITLALMAFAHWFIAYARIGINYNQTTLLEVLAVLTFWEGWQSERKRWFVVSGLATGAGLYLYFASRLVPILLVAFAGYVLLMQWTADRRRQTANNELPSAVRHTPSLRVQQLALWCVTLLLVFAPMALFFLDHAKEFNSRASFVFLFSDSQIYTRDQKLQMYTGTTDISTALAVQVNRYATLLNVGGDRSGQYGNQLALVEYYTATFFVLGLLYALLHAQQPRFMLLLMWVALTLLIGGVLTIESPFSPRIIGLMPVPFMLASVALDRTWSVLSAPHDAHPSRLRRFAARLVLPLTAAILLGTIIYSNYDSYFDHYLHSLDGWAQREPATAVAKYAAQLGPDQTMYMLSAPELFIWHGTIRFIAPNLRGFDMPDPESDLPVRDPNTKWSAFVMLPNHTQWLGKLRQLYPHGTLREWRRPWGELWFVIYEAPAEDVLARR